jgi:hypothetical protein
VFACGVNTSSCGLGDSPISRFSKYILCHLSLSFEDWEFPSIISMMEYSVCCAPTYFCNIHQSSIREYHICTYSLVDEQMLWYHLCLEMSPEMLSFLPHAGELDFVQISLVQVPLYYMWSCVHMMGGFCFQVFLIRFVWMSSWTNCGACWVSVDRHHPYLLFLCVRFWHLWSFVRSS